MIGSETSEKRGSPLALFAVLIALWVGGRTMLWESPLPDTIALPQAATLIADNNQGDGAPSVDEHRAEAPFQDTGEPRDEVAARKPAVQSASAVPKNRAQLAAARAQEVFGHNPRIVAGHRLLWAAALSHTPMPRATEEALNLQRNSAKVADAQPPFAAPVPLQRDGLSAKDRWSLDAWAFWRQGSNSTAISQGRVPIYGASQVGASLQYRLAPQSPYDLRAYGRAYRALVDQGETELAAGLSIRPLAILPVRAFAELRATDNAFGTELRPAVFAVTELPPVKLPVGLVAEAYGQGGYVGGDAATLFGDGQLSVTREVTRFSLADPESARLSLGAAAWGGAQEGAARLDLGPTLRLDLSIGGTPARVSVDWREQLAGDAAPGSGAAITVSTRF